MDEIFQMHVNASNQATRKSLISRYFPFLTAQQQTIITQWVRETAEFNIAQVDS